jgi:hypothetical protein
LSAGFVLLNFSAVPNLMLAVGALGFIGGLVGLAAGALNRSDHSVKRYQLISTVEPLTGQINQLRDIS